MKVILQIGVDLDVFREMADKYIVCTVMDEVKEDGFYVRDLKKALDYLKGHQIAYVVADPKYSGLVSSCIFLGVINDRIKQM